MYEGLRWMGERTRKAGPPGLGRSGLTLLLVLELVIVSPQTSLFSKIFCLV